MPAYRSIRISFPDRPGSLSSVSTALAVHGVDIVRLDVVSHEGSLVVDDLFLKAATQEDIGHAVGSFRDDVAVRTFDRDTGDPVLEMGYGLAAVASAATLDGTRAAIIEGVKVLLRGDSAALLAATPSGELMVADGPPGLPAIGPQEPFAGRWVLERESALAFPTRDEWAPEGFRVGLGELSWVAMAPCGKFGVLLVARREAIAFYSGELERLMAFATAAASIRVVRGERPLVADMPGGMPTSLPAHAVTIDQRLQVA